jgi:hypothetical protein
MNALALVIVLALSLVACRPRPLVVTVPLGPLRHDIGLWRDDDLICVAPPWTQQVYVTRRCVPMRTIRAVILSTHVALYEGCD